MDDFVAFVFTGGMWSAIASAPTESACWRRALDEADQGAEIVVKPRGERPINLAATLPDPVAPRGPRPSLRIRGRAEA